jgi:hypothetical protein
MSAKNSDGSLKTNIFYGMTVALTDYSEGMREDEDFYRKTRRFNSKECGKACLSMGKRCENQRENFLLS